MSVPADTVPRLHVVTDDRVLDRPDLLERARTVRAAGSVAALHVRGPRTGGRRLWELARDLRAGGVRASSALLVNDRVDVALLVGADGVHLGERSLPPDRARALLPAGALVGASVHDLRGATDAAAEGADYLMVGTIFPTPSHPGRPGAGPDLLRRIAVSVPVPLVAIGGVTPERVGPCLDAGAHGVAVLRGVWQAADTEEAVSGYLDALGVRSGGAPA